MQTADFDIAERDDGGASLRLTGDWTTAGMDRRAQRLDRALAGRRITGIDLTDMGRFDTSGALALFLAGGRDGLPADAWGRASMPAGASGVRTWARACCPPTTRPRRPSWRPS